LREQNKLMGEINYHGKMLQAVNQAAAFLLNSNVESFATGLFSAMGVMAETARADRVFVYKNHTVDNELYCTQIHEWSEVAEPQQGNHCTVDISYKEAMSSEYADKLEQGIPINGIFREMPHEFQQNFSQQGVVSTLMIPLFLKNQFWGFVGFDDCHNERVFTDDEVAILSSCGLLFANAVLRNEMVIHLQDTSIKLELALEQANNASKAKGDFLSNMSHEMRTPMNAIIGMTTIGKKTDDIAEKNRVLNKIEDASSHLLGIINDVLDMAKI